MAQAKAESGFVHSVKRCPGCFTALPMEEKVCPWCNQKVKKSVDKFGHARKPVNWNSYLICLLSWAGVMVYIWWVFLK